MSEYLADLDELVLRCRSQSAKEYIREAVACYRSGAFRSCVVSTWNAVVFDYIDKLRELELTGDGTAKSKLQNFDSIRSTGDWRSLWTFETDIPNSMFKEFDLISPVELKDIERLHEDRNRCAHPSMQSLEEPFQVTAELARYHLRSAIGHVLQHPPIQGTKARDFIFNAIKSKYFPIKSEDAIQALNDTPLERARESLVKSVVIGLTKAFLLDTTIVPSEKQRMAAALRAISEMYPAIFESSIQSKISDVLRQIADENLNNALYYIYKAEVWHLINEANQTKIRRFVESLNNPDEDYNSIVLALGISSETRQLILSKVEAFEAKQLEKVIQIIKDNDLCKNIDRFPSESIKPIINKYIDYAIPGFVNARNFDTAGSYSNDLTLVSTWFTTEQMQNILSAFVNNDQIYGASRVVPENMTELFKQKDELVEPLKSEWLALRQKVNGRTVYQELSSLIDQKFPNTSLPNASEET